MLKRKTILLLSFGLLLFAGIASARAAEQINNFEAVLTINSDGSINVSEAIAYDFGTEQKHGIYRDLPYKYQTASGNFKLRYSDFAVADGKGQAMNFTVESKGNNKRVKIGDANATVTGAINYVINYKVERAINYFDDYDELYWNVTGNSWMTPIKQSKTTVILPASASADALRLACYTGPSGSADKCVSSRLNFSAENTADKIIFSDDSLRANEGVTIVVGLPKGIVNEPPAFRAYLEIAKDNYIVLLPVIIFFYLFYLWKKSGKDPKGRGTIIAEFDAPDDLSPAEVGTIIDEQAQKKDISAEIIYLAVRGYIKIEKIQEKNILNADDYELTKIRTDTSGLNEFQNTLLKALFGENEKIKLADLKNKFLEDLNIITKKVYQSVVEKGYFSKNPQMERIKYSVLGVVIIILGIFLKQFFGTIYLASFAVSGLIVVIFSKFMPKKTVKGVLAREHILGLKTYLSVAEKDRINFHNAPHLRQGFGGQAEKNPQIFEKLLPYAMVLGVEKAWAKQFENIYLTNPAWYNDSGMGNFSALAFTHSLNSFQANANSIISATASSGASGFSGGGSGGGFGGGGGGSW